MLNHLGHHGFIRARYSDVKMRFFKKATLTFVEARLTRIRELRIWLMEKRKDILTQRAQGTQRNRNLWGLCGL